MSDPEQYKKIYPEQQLLPGEGFGQSTRYRDSAVDVNINSQTDDEGQCVQDMRDFNVRTLHISPRGTAVTVNSECRQYRAILHKRSKEKSLPDVKI